MGLEDARAKAAFGRTVPAVPENVASLRHSVVRLADRHGATEACQTDIALAVGEACANVVVHAYPPGDVGPLIVHAEVVRAREIVVTVCDQGQGMTPRPDSPGLGPRPAADREPRRPPGDQGRRRRSRHRARHGVHAHRPRP
jgi:anti-sigma regulatory factor (Ser/Thr protein kinase)